MVNDSSKDLLLAGDLIRWTGREGEVERTHDNPNFCLNQLQGHLNHYFSIVLNWFSKNSRREGEGEARLRWGIRYESHHQAPAI